MPKQMLLSIEEQRTRHRWAKYLSLAPGAILLSPLLLLVGLGWLSYKIESHARYFLLAITASYVPLLAIYFTPFLLILLLPLGLYYLALLNLSDDADSDQNTFLSQFNRYFFTALLFSTITAGLAWGSWLLFGATISAAYSAIAAFAVTLPFMTMFPPVGAVILLGLTVISSIVMLSYNLYQYAGQLFPDPDKAPVPASTSNPISLKPAPPSLPPSPPVITPIPPMLAISSAASSAKPAANLRQLPVIPAGSDHSPVAKT